MICARASFSVTAASTRWRVDSSVRSWRLALYQICTRLGHQSKKLMLCQFGWMGSCSPRWVDSFSDIALTGKTMEESGR